MSYDSIKKLAKEMGKPVPEVLALSRDHDPFFCGTAAHREHAKWFARMWKQEYEGQAGIHIRRVHYHLDAIQFKKSQGMHAVQKYEG